MELLLEELIANDYSRVFVLVDEVTEKLCLPLLKKYLFDIHVLRISSGEKNKSLANCEAIWSEMLKQEADRKSVLINLGGGVVGDIGGFCASLYKRGIDYIQVPTTLLAMVDSAIGGKTAVDFNGVKNVIGTFRQPKSIYINPDFLSTLPKPEWINGYAEIIKHGLIADKKYWEKVLSTPLDDWSELINLISGSIKIKLAIVKNDPFEKGERKLLNFGHTIGHAMEAYSLKHDSKPLKHGEAIAIGMICEAYLSKLNGGLSNKELRQITDLITLHFPKYSLRSILSPELTRLMRNDKKNTNEKINFTLLKKTGKGMIDQTCTDNQIAAALNYYDSL
jgi:3-dehydroquinate synthase